MTRVRAIEPCDVTCPDCGMHWTTQTPRSWWLYFTRCYGCQEPRGDGEANDA